MLDILRDNLNDVRERMAAACARCGRKPADVLLVAVTKTVGPAVIRALQLLGVTDIGESRVQDALSKHEDLGGRPPGAGEGSGLRWHMIGHLQTNKVRDAVRLFAMIHSLDSLRLAQELDRRAAGQGLCVPVLVECNMSGEGSKTGIAPGALLPLLDAVAPLRQVRVQGLMTMAPLVSHAEQARPVFAALRELAVRARSASGLELPHLSMGMSQDFEVAIEEGATLVRVGTALFRSLH